MGGSGRCASALSQPPATRRIFLSLASCKPNRSAQTGTLRAAAARAIAYRYAKRQSQVPAFFDYPRERPLKIGKRRENRRLAGVKNNVPMDQRPVRPVQSKSRSQPSFDAIADNRSAQRPRHREPDAHSCLISFARQAKRGEQRTGYASAVVIDRSEVGGAQNAGRTRERLLAAGAGFNGSSGLLFRR
jgi:hypothetical protein